MLKEILGDIKKGQNIDVYVAIIASLILAVLGFFNKVTIEVIGAALLAGISWLTFYALSEKRSNERQREELSKQINDINPTLSALTFFSENYVNNSKNFQDALQSAEEIFIAGHAQARMIIGYSAQITKILEKNGAAKFILMDPDGRAIEDIVKRSANPNSIDVTRHTFRSGLARLDSIRQKLNSPPKLQIKIVDFMLPHTIYGVDWSHPERAKIFVWFTPFKETSEKRPGFMLTLNKDPFWFSHFKQQFEAVWNWEEAKNR